MSDVRTRFAPSPTGFLHVGGVRTALFAWLIARQGHGQFILRLEDTDQAREVAGSDQHIMDSLSWLGLDWDEGPDKEGAYGPYRQSQRLNLYKEWAQRLVNEGRAYADPYSREELDNLRTAAQNEHRPFLFREHRPENPPTWDGSQPLRFKSDPKDYSWHDEVMGDLSAGPEVVDDFIIVKSDGFPTYNFAHIVDDELMKISHVIRSQEFLASVPRYLNLYQALGIEHPKLATLPYVMGPDGKKKLSKRDGAKDVLDYARQGYLPEALVNFLATLGWNDGTEQEIFSVDELIQKFDLGRVQRGGARFDEQRLLWMNGAHIRKLPTKRLLELVTDFWPREAKDYDEAYKQQVLSLIQERLKVFSELADLSIFFFKDLPVDTSLITNNKVLQSFDSSSLKQLLVTTTKELEQNDFSESSLHDSLNKLLTDTNQPPKVLFSLIRIAVTQVPSSPGLAETLAILGKDVSLRRIRQVVDSLAE